MSVAIWKGLVKDSFLVVHKEARKLGIDPSCEVSLLNNGNLDTK